MKKFWALFVAAAMVFCLAACTSNKQAEAEAGDTETEEDTPATTELTGGWQITENSEAALPEDVKAAFDAAFEGFTGSDVKPVAYFASQVVAGTNYMILCECKTVTQEPVTSYQVVVIYKDLKGNAQIKGMKEFDIAGYAGGEDGAAPEQEELSGGWNIPEDYTVNEIPEEAKAAFEAAYEGFLGNDLTPMLCLGTQVVSGTNYAFLCHSKLTTAEPVESIQVVTVYKDLDGNATLNSFCTVDPADYNE